MIKLKNLITEAGTLKAKRFTKDLAHDLGHQPNLMRPDKFKEFAELDRKGQAKAFNIWRHNVAMEQ